MKSKSPIYCEHANEMPATCPCSDDCYCKEHSCKPRKIKDIPVSANTKVRCPVCKNLGDLSSSEDWFLRNCSVDGDQLTADLTCMNCEEFSIPWEGTLAAGESDDNE